MEAQLLISILVGIMILLILLIRLKIPAFISLLISSIITGVGAGMEGSAVIQTVQKGMGGTLGFVATVVGLGAILGGILEKTNSAKVIAHQLLSTFGERKAPFALMLTGFFVSIPVFFDVGFIILFPIIDALHRKTGKSIVAYAIPLLAGLAVTHACIPPTPGPIAVADMLGASLGWVIFMGVIIGLPMAYLGGILYGNYIGKRLDVRLDAIQQDKTITGVESSTMGVILFIILFPIFLILSATLFKEGFISTGLAKVDEIIILIGHPFSALIIANLMAWYILGRAKKLSKESLTEISKTSLYPAGIIILVTGAGGVYKQMLIDTGAGELLASYMQSWGLSIILFAFLSALIIRALQGSATVAMITAAGLVAPLLGTFDLSSAQLACIVIAISSGATMVSHLNDSGFWLVKEYLQLDERQGILIWTVASTIIGLTGAILSMLIFAII